jgi:hypothetical protein
MKRLTKLGIVLLTIGLSFFVGTIYRSNSTYGFVYSTLFGLAPNTWDFGPNGRFLATYLWPPCDLRIEVKTNATIDMYILNAEGMRLWASDKTLKPIWSFRNVTQEIFTLQIDTRGEYTFLFYNPTNATSNFEVNSTLYGFERDLLWASFGFTVTGLIVATASVLMPRKTQKQTQQSQPRFESWRNPQFRFEFNK